MPIGGCYRQQLSLKPRRVCKDALPWKATTSCPLMKCKVPTAQRWVCLLRPLSSTPYTGCSGIKPLLPQWCTDRELQRGIPPWLACTRCGACALPLFPRSVNVRKYTDQPSFPWNLWEPYPSWSCDPRANASLRGCLQRHHKNFATRHACESRVWACGTHIGAVVVLWGHHKGHGGHRTDG